MITENSMGNFMFKKVTLYREMQIFLLFVVLTLILIIPSLFAMNISSDTTNFKHQLDLFIVFLITAVVELIWFLVRIVPRFMNYINLCRRFSDGEIYQDYIDGIEGLFPYLSDDIRRLDQLIDRQNTMQLSTKQAEFLALQNQINPHFLYNTLDSIRGDALAAGVDSIADITEALSTFFRYTITETRNLVTIREELENVRNYFKIQQYRFGKKLTMRIDIKDDRDTILDMECPKLFLQPIIENSIIHGLEKKSEKGILTICIDIIDDNLHINVTDNGVGMPDNLLDELNRSLARVSVGAIVEPTDNSHTGIALKNVCRRIKLLFGEQYGVHVNSIVNVGTRVEVLLPAIVRKSDADIK